MSNGAGKNYGGALLESARDAWAQIIVLEAKLLAARGALNEIAQHNECSIIVSAIAEQGLEASK